MRFGTQSDGAILADVVPVPTPNEKRFGGDTPRYNKRKRFGGDTPPLQEEDQTARLDFDKFSLRSPK